MLDLKSIINIIVNLPAQPSQSENFSLALFLSKNTVISTADRVKSYGSVNEMIAAGFDTKSPEVAAAGLYFGQTPAPSKLLVGVQGADETALTALTACRAANKNWYLCVPLQAAKDDIVLMASYIETAAPASIMFCTTADNDVKAGTAGNLCLQLQAGKFRRTLTQYSTFANAVASISGYACAANDGSQAFDLAFKTEPGVTAENLTQTDTSILENEGCNYYAKFEGQYDLFLRGNMADDTPADEVIGIDMLTAQIQSNVMSVLAGNPKIPLTDEGIALIIASVATACDQARQRGFLAAGTWGGETVMQLKHGDALANGYSIQAQPVSSLSASDHAARKAPPIYVCIILANSIRSVVLTVDVNR